MTKAFAQKAFLSWGIVTGFACKIDVVQTSKVTKPRLKIYFQTFILLKKRRYITIFTRNRKNWMQ